MHPLDQLAGLALMLLQSREACPTTAHLSLGVSDHRQQLFNLCLQMWACGGEVIHRPAEIRVVGAHTSYDLFLGVSTCHALLEFDHQWRNRCVEVTFRAPRLRCTSTMGELEELRLDSLHPLDQLAGLALLLLHSR